jgi:hypothetical protein
VIFVRLYLENKFKRTMKRTLLYATTFALSLLSTQQANAQCDPVISPSTMILCPDESDTLWSDVHDTYQWLQDGQPIVGETNQYFVAEANVVGGSMISVVTTTAGCPNATDTSDEVFIDGYMFLLPFVQHLSNDDHLCGNMDSVIFEFSYDSTVQWYLNGSPIPGADNDTFIAYTPGFYTVEGAPSVCPNFVMQLGLDLQVTETLTPVVTPDSQSFCPGEFASLSTNIYDSYQWFVDGNPIMNSNTPTFLTQVEGHFHVQITDGTCTLISDSGYVEEHVPITPVISMGLGQLIATPGGSQLTNFQWYLNGVAIPGATDSTLMPIPGDGDYTVSAFDGTCTDTSAVFPLTLSVNDAKANFSFKLFPNPSQGEVFINCAEAVSVTVMDNIGRIVNINNTADKKHHLELRHLSKGIYTIKLAGDKGSVYEKVILE